MTPVLEALHVQGKRVIVATRGPAAQLLRHSPFVDELLETPDPFHDLAGAVRSLRRQLQSLGLQPACVLTGSFDQRTRIVLLGALASNGWRGGYTVFDRWYQQPLAYDPSKSRIANNLRLAGLLGSPPASTPTPIEPKIFFTEPDLAEATRLLAPLRQSGRPILVAVLANRPRAITAGGAPIAGSRRLLTLSSPSALPSRMSAPRLRSPAIEDLRRLCGGISLAGQTPLPVLAAVLTLADLVVSVDTGTMHMARAARVPMVALAPSWQPAIQWMPLGLPQVRVSARPGHRPSPSPTTTSSTRSPPPRSAPRWTNCLKSSRPLRQPGRRVLARSSQRRRCPAVISCLPEAVTLPCPIHHGIIVMSGFTPPSLSGSHRGFDRRGNALNHNPRILAPRKRAQAPLSRPAAA